MREVRTHRSHTNDVDNQGASVVALDPEEAADRLLRDLRSAPEGLSTREAERRLLQYGPNTLRRQRKRRWPSELAHQFTHPLALLLWWAQACC
jgi:magnesium-transporting ATPase (P-type)